jgi:hypothetical protein
MFPAIINASAVIIFPVMDQCAGIRPAIAVRITVDTEY